MHIASETGIWFKHLYIQQQCYERITWPLQRCI